MIDALTFEDRRSICQRSEIDVLTFEDRCVDLRRSMCRPSKIDDRCVDLRRLMIDVSTFEHRWSMCRPSNIDGRCEIMLLYLPQWLRNYAAILAQNIDTIVVCELRWVFALQCFHLSCIEYSNFNNLNKRLRCLLVTNYC